MKRPLVAKDFESVAWARAAADKKTAVFGEMSERQKFDAWCERNHYYREGKRIYERRYGRDELRTSYPPKDLDLAWDAWQEALRTSGAVSCAAEHDCEWQPWCRMHANCRKKVEADRTAKLVSGARGGA